MLKILLIAMAFLAGLGVYWTYVDRSGDAKNESRDKEENAKATSLSLGELALEVQALRMVRTLNFSPDQIKELQELASETAMPARLRKGKSSAELRKVLINLRDALAFDDEDAIDSQSDQLDQLSESEKPELDDAVEATEAARKAVPSVLKHLKVTQFVAYVSLVADQVVDPADEMKERLDKVRMLSLADWKEQRDEIADGVAKLLAGVDAKKVEKTRDQVVALLSRARTLSEEDYQKKLPDLQKEIDDLVQECGPTEIVKHIVELALADLLSNPRLGAALEAHKPPKKDQ
ncbi:MAG: hypothetical protein ACJ8FY_03560 [Gemmataceae bacterium]